VSDGIETHDLKPRVPYQSLGLSLPRGARDIGVVSKITTIPQGY
jgi:hypothetical protein